MIIIPEKIAVEVSIQSRCFCCIRWPRSNSSSNTPESTSRKISIIFKTFKKQEQIPPPMENRATNFCEE